MGFPTNPFKTNVENTSVFQFPLHGLKYGEKMPPGAIPVSKSQVIAEIRRVVKDCPNSEIWAIKNNQLLFLMMSTFSGITINYQYRRVFKVLQYNTGSAFFLTVIPAALLNITIHSFAVTNNILTGEMGCSLCTQMQSASMSFAAGFCIPVVSSILGAMTAAKKYHTIAIPSISNVYQYSRFLKDLTLRGKKPLLSIAFINAAFGYFMANREISQSGYIWKKLRLRKEVKEDIQIDNA